MKRVTKTTKRSTKPKLALVKAEPQPTPVDAPASSDLLMPTLGELLKLPIPERQYLLRPWLREHESCLLYANTGVGKSLFALTAALAVGGKGSMFGWEPDANVTADDGDWRVLYVDGEMHIGDLQDRARFLIDAVPGINRTKAYSNLQFLARQQQHPTAAFPEITDTDSGGQERILEMVREGRFNLLILDNFSTLGRVADENAASSFDAIQAFLMKLKTEQVATILVHHTGKSAGKSDDAATAYRGSSKLAATFEILIHLKRYVGDAGVPNVGATYGEAHFEVIWDKLRGQRPVAQILANLTTTERQGQRVAHWDYNDTALERLHMLRQGLDAGLYKSQPEMAHAVGLHRTGAKRLNLAGSQISHLVQPHCRQWAVEGEAASGRR